jgi:nitrate/TMAO reductase-like tetraheme cytochrome c subunit
VFRRISSLHQRMLRAAARLSPGQVWAWLKGQPRPVAVAATLVTLFGIALAVNGGYRAYDYVQHDNDFCWSCHLMRDPFTAFDNSAHSGLGCKACHHPTLIERSKMGMVAILERPEEITHHADVSNDVCSACHVDGDPEEWLMVASTAGHQAHLDPYNRELEGVRCVQCHSAEVHAFRATDQACTQSGCHSGTTVVLGGMGELEITCLSCHFFERQTDSPITLTRGPAADGAHDEAEDDGHADEGGPVRTVAAEAPAPSDTAFHASIMSEILRRGDLLTPDHEQCTACHAMRERLEIDPAVEPHQAVCGACHDPHGDRSATAPARACATAECHGRPDTLDVDHHRWPGIDRNNCINCHEAHVFRADEDDCTSCHSGPLDRSSTNDPAEAGAELWRRSVELPPPSEEELRSLPPDPAPLPERPDTSVTGGQAPADAWTGHGGGDVPVEIPWLHQSAVPSPENGPSGLSSDAPVPGVHDAQQEAQEAPRDSDRSPFNHGRHRALACQTCHEGGTPRFADDPRWCDGCHHTPRSGRSCTACHRVASMELPPRPVEMRLPGGPTVRELEFPHDEHASQACSNCHGNPPTTVEEVDCKSCHAEHHGPQVTCARCHQEVPTWAHDPVLVHSSCSFGLCHSRFPPVVTAEVTPPELPPEVRSMDGPREGEPDWWRRNVCQACHDQLDPTAPLPRQPPFLQLPGQDTVGGEDLRIAPDLVLRGVKEISDQGHLR